MRNTHYALKLLLRRGVQNIYKWGFNLPLNFLLYQDTIFFKKGSTIFCKLYKCVYQGKKKKKQ